MRLGSASQLPSGAPTLGVLSSFLRYTDAFSSCSRSLCAALSALSPACLLLSGGLRVHAGLCSERFPKIEGEKERNQSFFFKGRLQALVRYTGLGAHTHTHTHTLKTRTPSQVHMYLHVFLHMQTGFSLRCHLLLLWSFFLLFFCPPRLCDLPLTSIFHRLATFILSFPQSIQQTWCKGDLHCNPCCFGVCVCACVCVCTQEN